MKVTDNHSRSALGEGRNHQMGFAFAKKVGEDFEAVQPISPCKSFLGDVVWAEHVNKTISCCGLTYSKQGIFDGETSYMAIKICDYKPSYNRSYPGLKADRKRLEDNYQSIPVVLNYFEDQLKVERKTEIIRAEDSDVFLLKFSYFWSKYPYLTSLYSLLVRMAQFYENKSVDEFLERFSRGHDMYLWKSAKLKFKKLLDGIPVQGMTVDHALGGHPHSSGIIEFKF